MKKKLIIIFSLSVFASSLVLISCYLYIGNSIPKVYIYGDISDMKTKSDIRNVSIKYRSRELKFETNSTIKVQGNFSLLFDKKNYTIKFYDKEYMNKKNIDVGWGLHNEYCLKANWVDNTHSRNIVSSRIYKSINRKYATLSKTYNYGSIDGYPVLLYNNNEFLGLYTFNIPKDDWVYGLSKNKKNNLMFTSEAHEQSNNFLDEASYGPWEIKIGEENEANLNKLNRLIDFVRNSNDVEFVSNFDSYLDLDSAINYIIVTEAFYLFDNIDKNLMLISYDGNIWYTILYDMDTSFGVNFDGEYEVDYTSHLNIDDNLLWKRIKENYKDLIVKRYFELREDILTRENIMNEFYNFKDKIPNYAFNMELKRWDNIPGYNYGQIEKYLDARLPLLDSEMKEWVK